MKQPKSQFILLLFAMFSLSSCLHIIEEITIKKDGSGTYAFKIDASEIQKMVGKMGDKAAQTAYSDSSATSSATTSDSVKTTDGSRQRALQHFQTQPGIHNVMAIDDSIHYVTGYTFDFDNVSSMRDAIMRGTAESTMGLWNEGSDAVLEKKTFTRKSGSSSFTEMILALLKSKGEEKGEDVSGSEGLMRMMLGSLSFKQVYHFPDRKIKSCNDKNGRVSDDKHSVTVITKPFSDDDKSSKKAPAELKIRLK